MKPALNVLQEHAVSKNGKLLSDNYINNTTKMEWQCEKGHIWSAHWNSKQSK